MADDINELARIIKNIQSRPYSGPTIGVVISPPPSLKVRLGDRIILTMAHLIVPARLWPGNIQIVDLEGIIANGTLTNKNTLVLGDEVILIPSANEQKYFLIDKAVVGDVS